MTDLACVVTVGPGEADRHLERMLTSARAWADTLVVYGDGPDPATCATIARFADHHWIGENVQAGGEHLVRNRLLELAEHHIADGVIVAVLDADETLHATPARSRAILSSLADSPAQAWCVHFLHVWSPDGTVHRVDGMWQPSVGPRIYRQQPGQRVSPPSADSWVCPPLPATLRLASFQPVIDVLHWGYALAEDRPRKHERYRRLPGHHPAHIESIVEPPTLAVVPPPAD
ncbi:MAG: hypothetical protein ACRDSS_03110 [Actinocrinis sp.]